MPKFLIYLLLFTTLSCESQTASEPRMAINPTPFRQATTLNFNTAVRSILEDSRGHYWFGSWQEGVCRYDGETFTYFTTDDGLPDNQVRRIQEDENGDIWFSCGYGGVARFDGKEIVTYAHNGKVTPENLLVSGWDLSSSDLWFNREIAGLGPSGAGVYRYDGKDFHTLAFPAVNEFYRPMVEVNGTITGMSRAKDGMLWLASYCGVFGFDGNYFHFINESGYNYHVRAILSDSKGRLWICNNGIGVLLYENGITKSFTEEFELTNDTYHRMQGAGDYKGTLTRVFSVGEDSKGNIWFGTVYSGLWMYDNEKVHHFTMEDGLTSMEVQQIYTDKSGQTWFGMGDGSVCHFNGETFEKIF